MTVVIIFMAMLVAGSVGLLFGYATGKTSTTEALKLARYNDAIALARDLIKTPDSLELRPRASDLIDRHEAANRKAA